MNMENRKPKISIIVPVYNVEPYLEKCLDSLLAQTYPDFEIILVNDASTDNGGKICNAYASRDGRVHAVHFPENRGPSAARNAGVQRAKGAYVSFVDSDDHVEPELLEKLYGCLEQNDADISICGTDGLKGNGGTAYLYSVEKTAQCLARRAPFLWTIWGKLFPIELAIKYPFAEQAFCCEDLLFFYQILKRVRKVGYVPDQLYHYIYREGSLINSGIDRKRCTVLSVLNSICINAAAVCPEMLPAFRMVALDTSVRLAMQAVEYGTADRDLFEYLKRFQKNARQHFRWEILSLCPEKKSMAAALVLCASTTGFWGLAGVYKYIKRLRAGKIGKMG